MEALDYKTEQRNMLEKLKSLMNGGPTIFQANTYNQYVTNLQTNPKIYLDIVSYANRDQIKSRYDFPPEVMKNLESAFMSKLGSSYQNINFKSPTNIKQNFVNYYRIIGFAKKIDNQVAFVIAKANTNGNLVQKKIGINTRHCKRRLFGKKCKTVVEYKDRGYYPHELRKLEEGLNLHNQIFIKNKLNTITFSDEIVISDDRRLYSLNRKISLGVKNNGIIAIYDNSQVQRRGLFFFQRELANFGKSFDVNQGPYTLRVKSSGNIVVQNKWETIVWQSHTIGKGKYPFNLIVTNDLNVVLIDKTNKPVWDRLYKYSDKENLIVEDYRIISNNKQYYATIKNNGYLNVYSSRGHQIIKSVKPTRNGFPPYVAYVDYNGKLVIVDKNDSIVYSSNVNKKGIPPFSFMVTDNGKLNVVDREGSIFFTL